jgi:hypothetical protein
VAGPCSSCDDKLSALEPRSLRGVTDVAFGSNSTTQSEHNESAFGWIATKRLYGGRHPSADRPEYATDNLYAGRGRIPNEEQRKRMVADWEKLAG